MGKLNKNKNGGVKMHRVKQLDKIYQQSSQKKKGDVMVRAIFKIRSISNKKTVIIFFRENKIYGLGW